MAEQIGGRVFFSNTGRTFGEEDELCVLSVGVDIGSSTSHLVFSRIVLERFDSRYVVTERESFFQSDILLTPYTAQDTIDADAVGAFIERQYRDAKVDPDEIDAGALILTGVAVRRRNARRIGELFARQAGRLVAVSAGDSLESVMAAYGSGAVARSIRNSAPVMNVDVGGGTAKIAVCADGKVVDVTALDIGARLVVIDEARRVLRVEEAGHRIGAALGLTLEPGEVLTEHDARTLAASMADNLFEAMRGGAPKAGGSALLRLDPLAWRGEVSDVSFSGGVSEYIYGGEVKSHGDLGLVLASELRARLPNGFQLARPEARIRATVIGAAQYTVQVSGSTIFVSPLDTVPLRNVPVLAPALPLENDKIEPADVAIAIRSALKRRELDGGDGPVAVFVPWRGSATFQRLDSLCRGILDGLASILSHGHPIVLIGDGDVGGLIGIHFCEEMKVAAPIVSIDGLELKDFDYIDIGAILDTSGAVAVVIKSLVFPASPGLGKEWRANPNVLADAAS
jgi:ethanolamine utilization protein EutA (predicted chaperonin)